MNILPFYFFSVDYYKCSFIVGNEIKEGTKYKL